MQKTSSILIGLSMFAALAVPALAYTPEELRAFALDAQKVAREVLDKCSDDQQKAMGATLTACMSVESACKDYASDTCVKDGEVEGRMPCDIECTTVRAIACIDEINAELPKCGITDRLKKPEELTAARPQPEDEEPIFASSDATAKAPPPPAPDLDAKEPPPSPMVLGMAAIGVAAVAGAMVLALRRRKP